MTNSQLIIVIPFIFIYFATTIVALSCDTNVALGPCINGGCGGYLGYRCDSAGASCCPVVNYKDPAFRLGLAAGGLCPGGYAIVYGIPEDVNQEGMCVDLQSIPGICSVDGQGGPCGTNGACRSGFSCFLEADKCCPETASCVDTLANCTTWAKNGYCTNSVYTLETKKATCAKTCNLCSSTPATPCVDVLTNCTTWAKNGYCTNSIYTVEMKKASCAKTCNLCSATSPETCVDSDPRCPSWGVPYCNSTFITPADKKYICAKTCNMC